MNYGYVKVPIILQKIFGIFLVAVIENVYICSSSCRQVAVFLP